MLKQERGRGGNRVLALTAGQVARAARRRTTSAARSARSRRSSCPARSRRAARPSSAPRSRRCGELRVARRPSCRSTPTAPVDELQAAVDAHPLHDAPGLATPRCGPRGRPTASNAKSRASNAASRAATRAWPGSSTACSACSRRGATCEGWGAHRRGQAAGPAQHRGRPRARGVAARRAARRASTPPTLAALVSCFTFQRRGPDGNEPLPPRRWPNQQLSRRRAQDRSSDLARPAPRRTRRAAARDPPPRPGLHRRRSTRGPTATTSPTSSRTRR